VPVGGLYIQDLVFLVSLELVDQLHKWSLNLLQYPHNLGSSWPSEFRELVISSFQCELELSLAYLNKLGASLDKGLYRSKDRIGTELPFSRLSSIDNIHKLIVDFPPLLTALNSIIQILYAFLHITVQHVINIYIGFASLDNLVGNFIEKTWDSFIWFVEFGMVPNHPDSLE
jgi:hypothetical protein